jgi:hypothetical protein
MPRVTPSVANGLAAALLFARGRPEGLGLLPGDLGTARFSFVAAIICLPAFLGIRAIGWATQAGPQSGVPVALLAELAGYAIAWAGFALASRSLAGQAQRGAEWPRFIAAWNWANVVQYVVLVVVLLPAALGLPGWIANTLGLVALGYALWLEWFVTRMALSVSGPTAVMFVLLDLALGLFIGAFTARIAGS